VYKDSAAVFKSSLNERAGVWEMNEEVFILGILHYDGEPVWFRLEGVLCADRENVGDAKLLSDVL